jgi:hypothetical protein
LSLPTKTDNKKENFNYRGLYNFWQDIAHLCSAQYGTCTIFKSITFAFPEIIFTLLPNFQLTSTVLPIREMCQEKTEVSFIHVKTVLAGEI